MAGPDAWNVFVCIFEDFKRIQTVITFLDCCCFIEESMFITQVDTISNSTLFIFIWDFQEHISITLLKTHLSGATGAAVRKVHFLNLYKDMFLKSQMKHVVAYYVYIYIYIYIYRYC